MSDKTYQINKQRPHPEILGLYAVERNGRETSAWAAENATFENDCDIMGGVFHGGEFRGGVFRDGVFHGGEFKGGYFRGGVFHDGYFYGGVFRDGVFHGGEFKGGYFCGGVFDGGVFHDGYFYGGVFRDGVFHGGEFNGGYFHGGMFRDGSFEGGVFRDGWLPLQIRGSKHTVNIPDGQQICIGCEEMSPTEWLDYYECIGKAEGYSPAQVEEYREYIELAAAHIERARGES